MNTVFESWCGLNNATICRLLLPTWRALFPSAAISPPIRCMPS